MTIHISKDTGCNLSCNYCYEEKDRDITGNDVSSQSLDVDAVIEKLEVWKEKYPTSVPGVHGGEPLLIDKSDLRAIFEWIHDNYPVGEDVGHGSRDYIHCQTNGTMISEDHIEMFEEYNVKLGISIDGPPELNRERESLGGQGQDVTDKMSQRTHDNLMKLAKETDVSVGIIVVPHKTNAGTRERRERLLEWMDELNQNGVYGHFNPAIPYEDIQTDLSLSPDELKDLFLETWEWMKQEEYRKWNPMAQYQDNLIGASLTDCVNNKCDVFNAGAAKIVTGEGDTTGCGKTWAAVGDGRPFLQGDDAGHEYDGADGEHRYEILKQTPGWVTEGEEDMGGCKGCKYWNVCSGGCPSAAWENDPRHRTRWCEAKYALYERIEQDMRTIFPNIRLITDFPWDANLGDAASSWELDIGPFNKMRPGDPGPSSVAEGYVENDPPELTEIDQQQDSFEQQVEKLKMKYDEADIQVDRENSAWHVDSGASQGPPEPDRDPNSIEIDEKQDSFEEQVEKAKMKYGEADVEVDRENDTWHADSGAPQE